MVRPAARSIGGEDAGCIRGSLARQVDDRVSCLTTIAVIQHEAGCPLGLLDAWLTGAGATLRVHRPYTGEPLPDPAEADGLIVLGGSMGATGDDDRHPWLPATR